MKTSELQDLFQRTIGYRIEALPDSVARFVEAVRADVLGDERLRNFKAIYSASGIGAQIDKLAKFLLANEAAFGLPGDEGAVDMAIRLLRTRAARDLKPGKSAEEWYDELDARAFVAKDAYSPEWRRRMLKFICDVQADAKPVPGCGWMVDSPGIDSKVAIEEAARAAGKMPQYRDGDLWHGQPKPAPAPVTHAQPSCTWSRTMCGLALGACSGDRGVVFADVSYPRRRALVTCPDCRAALGLESSDRTSDSDGPRADSPTEKNGPASGPISDSQPSLAERVERLEKLVGRPRILYGAPSCDCSAKHDGPCATTARVETEPPPPGDWRATLATYLRQAAIVHAATRKGSEVLLCLEALERLAEIGGPVQP